MFQVNLKYIKPGFIAVMEHFSSGNPSSIILFV